MKHRHNTLLRIVSFLLTVAMLTTTTAFNVLAEEVVDTLEKTTLDASTVSDGSNAAEVTAGTLDQTSSSISLKDILLRANDFENFTEEEKKFIRKLDGMDAPANAKEIAQEQAEKWEEYLDSLPELARYETEVAVLSDAGKTFSELTDYEKERISQYLKCDVNTLDSRFAKAHAANYNLQDSMYIVQISVDDVFTIEEALQLFKMYKNRMERDQNVVSFKAFAKCFDIAKSDKSQVKEIDAELLEMQVKRQEIREAKEKYIDKDALAVAKTMFLDGNTVKEIKAAFAVAATFNLDPKELIISKKSISADAESTFEMSFPVNMEALLTKVSVLSSFQQSKSNAAVNGLSESTIDGVDWDEIAEQVGLTAVALYSSDEEVLETDPVISSVQQPLDMKIGEKEDISLNTGALTYSELLASLPSINNTSLNVRLNYDSAESNLAQYDYGKRRRTKYYCKFEIRYYLDRHDGPELQGTEVYVKQFNTLAEAQAYCDEISGESYTLTLDSPVIDSYPESITYSNLVTRIWVDNPEETISQSNSSTAPSENIYIPNDGNGYSGTLYKGVPYIETSSTRELGEYAPGRMKYQTDNLWKVVFSGTLSKELTTEYALVCAEEVLLDSYYTYYNNSNEQTYNESRYDLGSGWSLSIPSINRDAHGESLILPGIGTYALSGNTIKDYKRSDMKLTSDKSYNNGQFSSTQKLTFADGTVYYFSSDGLLLAMVDKFGTTVTFKYAQVNDNYHPSEIIDADGHSTTITYATTDTGSTITITAPDGSVTTLHTKELDSETYGTDNSLLEKIVYPDGETVSFDYTMETGTYSFTGSSGGLSIQYALLNQVTYDAGAKLHYAYEMRDVKLSSGHLNTYRLTERYTTNGTDDMQRIDRATYSYTGDYSRETTYKTAVSEVKNGQIVRTEYTFNKDHLCTLQEIQVDGTMKQKVATTYDNYKLPNKVVQTIYGTDELSTTELYTHDKYGNTLTYLSPKAEGNANNTDYRTTYTYDSTYNLPLTVEYKQDAATTIKIVNTLTADKKSIAETATYVNNTLTALTTYTYNTRGQVTAKTDCLDLAAKTGVTTVYTYNGANLATETITGLTDADGNPLPDLVTAYTYDTMGRLLTTTDAAGRTTTNTYDVRGRLLTTTAPDGSVTAYTYDLAANDTTVSQPGREDITVDFDSIGQKQAVYYPSGDLQKEYYYDTAGRLVIEATGRGSSAANTVYYTYDPLDRLIEKRICDKDGVELYRETTAYDDALTENQVLVTKTVLGEDGAPSTISKTYENAYGETVREDVDGMMTDYAYDFVGNRIRTSYTEDGKTVSASDTYDFRGNLTAETNALGNTRTVTYDAIGRKIAESDFKGNATTYAYDAAGRLLISSAPLDGAARSIVKYAYDSAGNVTRQLQSAEAVGAEAPAWRTVEYVYDDHNRVTDIAQTADETHKVWTHYAYNEAGDLTDIYTGLSLKWSLAINPETYSHTHYVYNNRGKATSLTDALGQTETYVYDALGYLIEATGRDGKVTRYTYTGLGKPLTEAIYASAAADAPAAETVYTYYRDGLTRSVTADGSTVQYTYDAHGNVLTESDETATRTYTYDSRGRKSSYALTAGDTEISTAAYAYDDLNRLVSVTEGGVTTTYTYDANGNRASQTTGEVSVAYTYNDANLVTSLTNTLTNASGEAVVPSAFAYTYYADGNQHTKTEAMLGGDPVTTTYVYDGLGRLTAETKGEDSIAYTYDANGNRIGMNQNGTVTSYTYDANNRLLGETINGITTPFTYDADGNMLATVAQTDTAHIFEDGTCRLCEDLQTYRLGDLNLDGEISLVDVLGVLKLCDSSSAQAETALLSAVSAETISADSADLNGNGVLDTEDYMLFLQGLLGDAIAPATLYATEEKSDVRTDAWAAFADLDGNGIVEGADYSIALTVMSAPTPHLTDRMARLIADVNGDGVVNRTDAVDLTSYLTNGDSPYPIDTVVSNTTYCPITKAYTYNARNQQTHFNTADVSASYAYNPSGLRNVKTVGGSTKYFVYNGMNIVYEYSESVADGVAYFYGLNRTHNSKGEIYVYNAHGDVVQLVKDNAVVASYTYDAFGNLTSQIGESDNPFLYCGEYFDAETQTYYLRARYYNPANGRFTQQDAWALMDASDPLSLNLYAYCCNNPVMYVDLTGNWPTFAQIATAVAVVAVGAVLVAATIASAGTVGAVAGAAAATYFGVSATTAAAVTTAATVGTYAVAAGIGATYASDAGEILTGHNVIRDDLMGSNQQAYDAVRTGLNVAAVGATYIGDAYRITYPPKHYTAVDDAPLEKDVADNFEGGSYTQIVLPKRTVFYRVYGGEAKQVGRYMTRVRQNGGLQSQIDLALNPKWGNTAEHVTKVVVPKGTFIYEGKAALQPINDGTGMLIGGGNQVYIREVEGKWFR